MPQAVNPFPALHLLVFVPTIPVTIFKDHSNRKIKAWWEQRFGGRVCSFAFEHSSDNEAVVG